MNNIIKYLVFSLVFNLLSSCEQNTACQIDKDVFVNQILTEYDNDYCKKLNLALDGESNAFLELLTLEINLGNVYLVSCHGEVIIQAIDFNGEKTTLELIDRLNEAQKIRVRMYLLFGFDMTKLSKYKNKKLEVVFPNVYASLFSDT